MTQAAFLFDAAAPASGAAALGAPARHPAVRGTAFDEAGFEIGWDFARHRLTPPLPHLHADNPVRQGWGAARAVFGHRTLRPNAAARRWLALRLQAWQHGQAFEGVQATPHFIAQLQVSHCPVTGELLGGDAGVGAVRLNPAAAYVAGNLAVLGATAGAVGDGMDWQRCETEAIAADASPDRSSRGLGVMQRWLAVLKSFTTPTPHAVAAQLPLLVLPPNRVRVLNPVQALQVMLTLQFCEAGYARRLVALAALMPSSELRQAFQVFMHTLLARRLAAGADIAPAAMRAAMELAWGHALVQRRWQRLATRLTADDCEQLLQRAGRRGLLGAGQRWQPLDTATEGWALECGGRAELAPAIAPAADQASAISATDGAVSANPMSH